MHIPNNAFKKLPYTFPQEPLYHPSTTSNFGQPMKLNKVYKTWAEIQTGLKIACQRDGKGGEFIFKEWDDFCNEYGIET